MPLRWVKTLIETDPSGTAAGWNRWSEISTVMCDKNGKRRCWDGAVVVAFTDSGSEEGKTAVWLEVKC